MKFYDIINKLFYINNWQKKGVFVLLIIVFILGIIKISLNNIDVCLNAGSALLTKDSFVLLNTNSCEGIHKEQILKKPIKKITKDQLFYFNPNVISDSQMEKLGFNNIQIKTINNYRNKGGWYYKEDDFAKMYNFTKDEISLILPFVKIESKLSVYSKKIYTPILIDLNNADSLELIKVRGIGPVFAMRIIKYRNLIGGFYCKEQLREVWGIDSIFYNLIVPQVLLNDSFLRKLNINKATYYELASHPYIGSKKANIIINYRRFHYPFSTIYDIQKTLVFDDSTIKKIAPYISF
ncbi:MAG: hypothetical protein A2X12_06475 [Bacteroidetes bacterium GWE2_29_8]|nr:MAG: hypothetical protein A2X12_06475 [Bacteroidetes bacterium GWE2_29_8]